MLTNRRSFFRAIASIVAVAKTAPANIISAITPKPKRTNSLWIQSEIVRKQMFPKFIAQDFRVPDFPLAMIDATDYRIPWATKPAGPIINDVAEGTK